VRRRGDAVRPAAEVDVIQVQIENLIFAELGLDLEREDHLLRLAL
jgi:hypothetical protein